MTDTLITFDNGTLWQPIVAGENGIHSVTDAYTPYFGNGIHNNGVFAGDAANTVDARFRVELGLSGDHYGSIYMGYVGDHASAGDFVSFFSWVNSSNSIMASLRVGGNRELQIRVGASTIVRAGSPNEIPVGFWFRFDWQVSGTTINWRMHTNPYAAVGDTPALSGSFTFASATIARLVLGPQSSDAITKYWVYDTVRATDTGTWYGSYSPPAVAPTVKVWNGTAEVDGVVTIWDGTTEVSTTLEIA